MNNMKLLARHLLTSTGWQQNQLITIIDGIITDISPGDTTLADECKDWIIPGMINCHSHAFQRALAGFTEQGSGSHDSFWTWRDVMYKFLGQLTPDDCYIIARQLYIEMLKAGYTRVAEFHYLHHDHSGKPYAALALMSEMLFEAAKQAGLGFTLLPVLYQYAGFGQQLATFGQRRFINTTDQFNQLVADCFSLSRNYQNSNVGIAPHSLRATDKHNMLAAIEFVHQLDSQAPIHLHIAEQQKEVQDCQAYYGQRPVEWLYNHFDVDKRWCLIHATHLTATETQTLAHSSAIAGICPTTEANLGDGIFPTTEYLQLQGRFAIGSDSHISVNAIEELRWLEYAQRLTKQQRALLATEQQPSVGLHLWQQAALGGAQSTHSNSGEIAVGKQADLIALDPKKIALYAHDERHLLDSVIFAQAANVINDVMVNGQWCIVDKHHILEQQSEIEFSALLARLSQQL
jgi:formimidoylglutamate deiminase